MTRLRLRAAGDDGSALAIALTFLMIFGLIIGVVLQFATTGQRTTLGVREEATNTYAGGAVVPGCGTTTVVVDLSITDPSGTYLSTGRRRAA